MRIRKNGRGETVAEIEQISGSRAALGQSSYEVAEMDGLRVSIPKQLLIHLVVVLANDMRKKSWEKMTLGKFLDTLEGSDR